MLESECLYALSTTDSIQSLYNLLGITGFLLSAIIWIYTIFQKRCDLFLDIKDYTKVFGRVIQLYLYIQNLSDSPITISGISIAHNNTFFPCELLPKKIRGEGDSLIKTPMFPINLAPHQGILVPFEFLNCQDIALTPYKTLDLEIYTNRKVLRKSLTLVQPDHLLH